MPTKIVFLPLFAQTNFSINALRPAHTEPGNLALVTGNRQTKHCFESKFDSMFNWESDWINFLQFPFSKSLDLQEPRGLF